MRLLVLAALAAAFSIAPTNAQPQPKEPDLATRVRELEERLAQVERKLSIPQEDLIPLGDITVNLAEDRLQRYLRVKVVIKVDVKDHRQMQAAVAVRRAELKSWAITHLMGKTVKDVSGAHGVATVQKDLTDGFGKILQGERKANPIVAVLFEEYVIQ